MATKWGKVIDLRGSNIGEEGKVQGKRHESELREFESWYRQKKFLMKSESKCVCLFFTVECVHQTIENCIMYGLSRVSKRQVYPKFKF